MKSAITITHVLNSINFFKYFLLFVIFFFLVLTLPRFNDDVEFFGENRKREILQNSFSAGSSETSFHFVAAKN